MSDVLILYQISNEFKTNYNAATVSAGSGYNAFYLPRKNNGITLSSIKSHIRSSLGHDQYHWRVRIDDRPATSNSNGSATSSSSSGSGGQNYSWWDIQDENARLPIKEATPKELKKMFGPPKKEESSGDVTQEVTKAAKGAMKYMGKAMNVVAGSQSSGRDHHHSGGGYDDDHNMMEDDFGAQRTAVICFKVLDLNKVRLDNSGGGSVAVGGGGGGGVRRAASAVPRRAQQQQQQQQQRPATSSRAPASAGAPRRIPSHRSSSAATPAKTSGGGAPTGNLMDFGSTTSSQQQQQRNSSSSLHHANSMPSSSTTTPLKSNPTGKAHPNETRAEKLKREYAKKNAQSNRVWDEVDQRWVEGPVKNGEVAHSAANGGSGGTNAAASSSTANITKSVKGISLSTNNAIGKSANVQAAVHARVAEMESSQQKAVAELRNREAAKAKSDAEEDLVRQRLEPKLKAWSEEHGQKKQLRALLANLHTILWEGSGWKQVSLADVLDDSKVKRVYHKASRVVHPDKTMNLDVEKKFVAKRVFDALTQAKVAFDEGKR